jgi:PKHD-type hydroxylase
MILKNSYWVFDSVISEDICKKIIKLGKKQTNKKKAEVGTKQRVNNKIRDCSVSFFSDKWVYDILNPYLKSANNSAEWNFDINFCEPLQYCGYKKSEYYKWHQDTYFTKNHEDIRKLSLSLALNDNSEYEGGKFQFDLRDHDTGIKRNILHAKELNKRGTIIVFPSFLTHRITPVTKGVRYSLVGWFKGPKFR